MNVPAPVRKLVLLGTPILAVLVMGATSIALQSDLPAEVPSHWGSGGLSDDTMPLWAFTALTASLAVLLGLGFQSMRHRIGEPFTQRLVGGLGVGMSVWLAALHVGTLLAARGTTGPIPFPTSTLLVALAVGLAATAGAAAIVRPIQRTGVPLTAETLEVAPGEAVVWTGSSRAAAWVWVVLATVVLPIPVMVAVDLWPVAVLLVLVALLGMTMLRVRVSVGPQGLVARTGPLGLLRFRAPVEDIDEVHAEIIDPLAYGGWGFRMLPGVRGLVVRRGPGLRIERREAPTLVITVDGAAAAAGVLQAHLAATAKD